MDLQGYTSMQGESFKTAVWNSFFWVAIVGFACGKRMFSQFW
jgi:hypothetical protein